MSNPLFNLFNSSSNGGFNFNDLMSLIAATKNGDPTSLLQSMAASNPEVAQVLSMLKGVSPQNFEPICRNFCAQKGIDFNQVYEQFKHLLGK